MSATRLISILLPFFNEERFISRCLESIVDQDYTNWELIAIDDHSNDKSPEMVKEMARSDPRIRYLLNPGKGVIDALQNGFDVSTGQLVTRMDADDHKSPDNLSSLERKVTGPGILATGLVRYFSDEESGVRNGYRRYEHWINEVIRNEQCHAFVYKECTIPSPCWMVHRDDLEKAGAFRSDRYPEDYDLCLRFFRAGLKVNPVKNVIHFWRDHETRVTRNDHRYADNFFIDLKLPYFLEIEYHPGDRLVLWGAGRKAKEIARRLVERKIEFQWISNNQRKTGLDIYGVRLTDQDQFRFEPGHKLILAVSGPKDQSGINQLVDSWGITAGMDYWWFC